MHAFKHCSHEQICFQKIYSSINMKVGFVESKDSSLRDHLKSVPKLQMRYNEGRSSGYGEEAWIRDINMRCN